MATAFYDTFAGKVFRIIIGGRDKKHKGHGDPTREVFETVVFVVVLVLMLKLFVAEAFVIPSGSMDCTLWRGPIKFTCPECGNRSAVTAAASHGPRTVPSLTFCQNCGVAFKPESPKDWNSGDRVLVEKFAYHIGPPRRFDVPVFKYPKEPYNAAEKTAMNYIKRLAGLPGETIAIYQGDLYRTNVLKYEEHSRPARLEDLWQIEYAYRDDQEAFANFYKGGFEPIRKDPKEILAVRRLVFDLDQQPKSLGGLARVRWQADPSDGAGWAMEERGFRHTGGTSGWMRYQHVEPGSWSVDPATGMATVPKQPDYIRDHLAYNVSDGVSPGRNWVPDLLVECDARLESASDKVTLELTKAGDKFQAVFDNGVCRLFRISPAAGSQPEMLDEQQTRMTGLGKYSLRFANFDSRLTVWVDGRVLNFGGKSDYPPPDRKSFGYKVSDLHEPARIGATGNVTISRVSLWRDVYYTCEPAKNDQGGDCQLQTFYVQPGHYFCLGDNSASSADGRSWGLVPERLMLGKAVVVYWPISRIGVIK